MISQTKLEIYHGKKNMRQLQLIDLTAIFPNNRVLILVVVLSLSLYLLMSSSNEQANNRNTRLVQQTRAAEVANKISSTSSLLHNRAFSKKERLRDTIGSAKSILISW